MVNSNNKVLNTPTERSPTTMYSPKSWKWNTINQSNIEDSLVKVDETVYTTPVKQKPLSTNQEFEGNNIYSISPETIKVLTPKIKYSNNKEIQTPDFSIFDKTPPTISPATKKYVSQLIELPSPLNKVKNTNMVEIYETKKLLRENNILQKKVNNLKKLLKMERTTIGSLKKIHKKKNIHNNKPINVHSIFEELKFSSENSKSVVSMQLLHKKRKKWLINEKKIALSLYYKSPATYKFMRKNDIILPGESTIRRWLNSINYSTGFPPKYMEQIKLKISGIKGNEKKCAI
ncbi:uncharacterized protein LOC111038100 [Myzus persicae]|uniref:uncharacterized protein LOC111038100 n=1 Tax=Myzus persicae TaxID=13164 RepID=UPI000B938EEC|nr:uncharacterized protein LOC111038100 [Myzus persicae]